MIDPDRLIQLGEFGAAHGIRGEISIRTFTADPEDIAAYGPLSDKSGHRTFTITSLRATPKGIIARLSGVDDRTAAEKLRNVGLYVKRSRLPPPEAGAYYHEDLIGMEAITEEGSSLGRITAVLNYGAGDIIEIAKSGETDSLLIPFTNAAVPTVDPDAKRIVVVLPDVVTVEDETQETE